MIPIDACTPATTWATTNHDQNRSPGASFLIQAAAPQIHPTLKIATTANPTNLCTSITAGILSPATLALTAPKHPYTLGESWFLRDA